MIIYSTRLKGNDLRLQFISKYVRKSKSFAKRHMQSVYHETLTLNMFIIATYNKTTINNFRIKLFNYKILY